MPELKKTERQIAAQIANETMAQPAFISIFANKQPVMVLVVPARDQILDSLMANHVEPVRSIDAVLLKVRVVEKDAAKIV